MDGGKALDLIIVGGGIGGLIGLKYAVDTGLAVRLLEREPAVGGLWRKLPPWQDIQFRREDWTLGDLPMGGEDQASVLANIEAWVPRFGLAPYLRLGVAVRSARPTAEGWEVVTDEGVLRSRYLLAATGGHNRPLIPPIERSGARVEEHHASDFRNPGSLRGRAVAVVGGGASAHDLLDLAFREGAASVAWIYRSLKWVRPSTAVKGSSSLGMRRLAQAQMLGIPVPLLDAVLNRRFRAAYEAHGMAAVIPERPFSLMRDQLLPGRERMVRNFDRIVRHRGEVARIEGDEAVLRDGTRLRADLLLWGTGYALDLSYLEVPELARRTRLDEVAARCGALFLARDAPNLFLLAPSLLDGTAPTPFNYCLAARSFVSHIQGAPVFDLNVVPRRIQYFDLARFLAPRDRRNYPRGAWWLNFLRLAFPRDASRPLPLP